MDELQILRKRIGEMAAEIERLQSVIDEANAQEPYRYIGNGKTLAYPNPVYENDADWVPVYARPIPAQQSPEKTEYVPISKDLKSVFIDGFGLLPIQYPNDDQSPAVSAPDMFTWLPRLMDDYKRQAKLNGFTPDVSLEMVRSAFSVGPTQSPRITEQDAREWIESAIGLLDEYAPNPKPFTSIGRALLEKLNKPDSVGG